MLPLPRKLLLPLLIIPLLASLACGSAKQVPFPTMQPVNDDLVDRIHTIRDGMADFRAMVNNKAVTEGTVSREQLQTYFDQSEANVSKSDQKKTDHYNAAMRLLHMEGPEEDATESTSDFYGDNIAGLYFFDDNRLALIGGQDDITPDDELTLAHEYMHSFQDVTYDIGALNKLAAKKSTEYATTISCLYEGDATFSSLAYMAYLHGPAWFASLGGGSEDVEAPPSPEEGTANGSAAIGRYLTFNYRECPDFVASIYLARGLKGVDALYKNPPSTTEQILHPDKYLAHEGAKPMSPIDLRPGLAEGWSRITSAPFGEFDVLNYMLSLKDDAFQASGAAAGWGAGWMSVYAKDGPKGDEHGSTLVHIQLTWDTNDDAEEFMALYRDFLRTALNDRDAVVEDSDGTWRWDDAGAAGSAVWSRREPRVDIVIGTDEATRETALKTLATPSLIYRNPPSHGLLGLARLVIH